MKIIWTLKIILLSAKLFVNKVTLSWYNQYLLWLKKIINIKYHMIYYWLAFIWSLNIYYGCSSAILTRLVKSYFILLTNMINTNINYSNIYIKTLSYHQIHTPTWLSSQHQLAHERHQPLHRPSHQWHDHPIWGTRYSLWWVAVLLFHIKLLGVVFLIWMKQVFGEFIFWKLVFDKFKLIIKH